MYMRICRYVWLHLRMYKYMHVISFQLHMYLQRHRKSTNVKAIHSKHSNTKVYIYIYTHRKMWKYTQISNIYIHIRSPLILQEISAEAYTA